MRAGSAALEQSQFSSPNHFQTGLESLESCRNSSTLRILPVNPRLRDP
jgi:hypothetical protein